MNKKYQVFVSSTYEDLIDERKEITQVILQCDCIPAGMELWPASNKSQWEVIKSVIEESDYYLLIIAGKYGSTTTDENGSTVSYTEMEFDYAMKAGKPVIALVHKDIGKLPSDYCEMDSGRREMLERFRQKAMDGRLAAFWTDREDLKTKAVLAIAKAKHDSPGIGWIRSDAIDIEKNLKVITDLTERNLTLEKENTRLKSELEKYQKDNERKPKLVVSFTIDDGGGIDNVNSKLNPYTNQDLMTVDETGKIHFKIKRVCVNAIKAEFLPWTDDDTASYQGNGVNILDKDIEEYNRALPQENEVQEYLQNLEAYLKIKDNGVAVVVLIDNEGTAKASLISLTLEFPEGIGVFDTEDIENLSEPEKPRLPKSPVEKALERQNASYEALNQLGQSLGALYNGNTYGGINFAELAVPNLGRVNGNESFEVSGNTVYIKTKNELVHTENDYFPGVYIVPLKAGEFQIKATVMCSEYLEPEIQYINVVCED